MTQETHPALKLAEHPGTSDCAAELICQQHALIVQMAEWAESYMDAQGALDNRELLGPNAPPYWELQAKCNRNREAFEDALTEATEYLKAKP